MEKNLKNAPTAVLNYGWNLFVFARKFETEINAPPAVVAHHLNELVRADDGSSLDTRSQTASITPIEADDLYTFDLRVRRRLFGEKRPYTSVKATGRIIYSKGYQTTIVRGDIRLGWVYYVGTILFTAYILLTMLNNVMTAARPEFALIVLTLIMVGLLMSWRQFFKDYQLLTRGIQEKLNAAIGEHAADRATISEAHLPLAKDLNTIDRRPYPHPATDASDASSRSS